MKKKSKNTRKNIKFPFPNNSEPDEFVLAEKQDPNCWSPEDIIKKAERAAANLPVFR